MSDSKLNQVGEVYSVMQADAKQGPLAKPLVVARMIAICAAVGGAVPTGIDLFHSWKHNVPMREVSHRLDQYELWLKNIDCKVEYRSLNAGNGIRIDAGACPKSRDIALKLTTQEGSASHEWISFTKLQKAQARSAMWDLFISTAAAEEVAKPAAAPGASPSPRIAQAPPLPAPGSAIQIVCQALQGKDRITRVVNEAGKCFRETFSPFQGRVDKREEVPCNTQCPGPQKS